MKVCLFNHNVAWSGGTFVRCLSLATELCRVGHEATIVTTAPSASWSFRRSTYNGVEVVECPAVLRGRFRSGWDPFDVVRRLMAVGQGQLQRPDVIHAFDCRPTVILPALMLARRVGAPLVLDWADWWGRGGTIESRDTGELVRFLARGPETWFEEAFRKRAKRTTVISTALARRARDLGVPERSITLIPHGCDITAITPVDSREARRRCGLAEDIPVVGYEGGLLREDAPLLFRVFQSLRSLDQRTQLLHIGDPRSALPELPGIVRSGFVPRNRLSDFLGACDVFLLPLSDTIANRGRWPSKMNDYLSAGRPTVATPVGDLPGLFSRLEIGVLGVIDDGSFLAATLNLLANPATRVRMGHNARLLAETELAWSSIVGKLVEVYEQALTSSELTNSSTAEPH